MTVCGDGGAVTTNDSEIAEKVSMLADQGRKKGEKYRHDLVGYNFRMSEIHAAIGKEQLKHLPEWIKNRRKNAGYYTKLLSDIEGVVTPSEKKWAKHVYHLYVIRTEQRDELKEYLKKQGISTGIHYPVPVHRQPCITQLIKPTTLFVTDKIADEVLSLPMHPQLKFNDIEFIVKKIREFYG